MGDTQIHGNEYINTDIYVSDRYDDVGVCVRSKNPRVKKGRERRLMWLSRC